VVPFSGFGQLAQSHKSLLEEDNVIDSTSDDGETGGLLKRARELMSKGKGKWKGLSRKKKIAIMIGIFGGFVVGMVCLKCAFSTLTVTAVTFSTSTPDVQWRASSG
jgi:hypothetical protein